jgi:hypothetical protein
MYHYHTIFAEYINNEQMNNHTHTQYTNVFTWKPKKEENHIMIFLICLEEFHSLEAPTSFVFQLQQEEGSNPLVSQGTNMREAPTPQFSGYNQKEATTPYVLRLQLEGGYNHMSLPRPTDLMYK